MEIEVRGGESCRRAAAKLRSQTEKRSEETYRRAISRAAKPLGAAVKAGVPGYMPGGYAPVFAAALRLTTAQRDGGVAIKASAKGAKGHDRGIARKEAGILNVPNWPRGRRRSWSWRIQRARRAHFFTEPIDRRKQEIRRAVVNAMEDIARRLGG